MIKEENLKNLSSNSSEITETVITAKKGLIPVLINNTKIFLFDGEVISSKKNADNEILKFDQLDIDLSNLQTTTIKLPKIQEISSWRLLSCFLKKEKKKKNFVMKILIKK